MKEDGGCAPSFTGCSSANGRGEELIAPNDSGRHGTLSAGHGDTLDTVDTRALLSTLSPHIFLRERKPVRLLQL